nr:hypothetical protein [Tanacetum cinerariifolium]
ISDAMGALVNPLSSKNLIGEASTSEVPATAAATTTTLFTSVTAASANSIPPILVADYDVLDAGILGHAGFLPSNPCFPYPIVPSFPLPSFYSLFLPSRWLTDA